MGRGRWPGSPFAGAAAGGLPAAAVAGLEGTGAEVADGGEFVADLLRASGPSKSCSEPVHCRVRRANSQI